jgi:nucleoside-diphosphate-sugar epimerase
VYHLAARVEANGRWADFRRTTIDGTRRLLDAALPNRPARFVYVSSGSVYSPKHLRGGISAERTPALPPRLNGYGRAKLEAENLVRSACAQAGCPWTIVRLGCTVYGPGFSPLLRNFVPLAGRSLVWVVGDGQNQFATLYVDDAARAILQVGTHPAAGGKIYDVASEEPVTQREFLNAMADALGVPRPRRHLRGRVAWTLANLAGALGEAWAWLGGTPPPVNRYLLLLMGVDQIVDTGPIRRELGWRPQVDFREGTRRMQEWYRRQGQHGQTITGRSSSGLRERASA